MMTPLEKLNTSIYNYDPEDIISMSAEEIDELLNDMGMDQKSFVEPFVERELQLINETKKKWQEEVPKEQKSSGNFYKALKKNVDTLVSQMAKFLNSPAIFATAAVCVLAVILYFVIPPLPKGLIDRSYDVASSNISPSVLQTVLQSSSLDWENVTPDISNSFSESSLPSYAQAFRAGFRQGKQKLSSLTLTEKDWSKTKWENYFKLGRWLSLLDTVCQSISQHKSEIPVEFWNLQKQIFAQQRKVFLELQEKGENLNERKVAQLLIKKFDDGIEKQENIEQLLEQLSNEPQASDYAINLSNKLKAIRREF